MISAVNKRKVRSHRGAHKTGLLDLVDQGLLKSVENIAPHGHGGCAPGMNGLKPGGFEKMVGSFIIHDGPFSDSYEIEEEIGRGKFAKVKKCRHRDNGVLYAAKFLRKRRKGKDCRNEILHEVVMLQKALESPRLVHLIDVYETVQELILVTEFAAGGELFQHVVSEECFKEREVVRLMRQILEGLSFLHSRHIVHLDVKPQNILLTDDLPKGDIKLCDFGFARLVNSGEDIRDIIGTPDYVAPEVLSYEPIKTSCDMWSVGVLAYVMLTAHSPFAGETKQETFLNISQVNLDFPDDLFEDISSEAKDFIRRVLVRTPSERMSAQECLRHPWICTNTIRPPVHSVSPFGSPVGCRRAHSPPAPESMTEFQAHSKKYKYDDNTNIDDIRNNYSSENLNEKNTSSLSECTIIEVKSTLSVTSVNTANLLPEKQLAC